MSRFRQYRCTNGKCINYNEVIILPKTDKGRICPKCKHKMTRSH